MQKFIFNVDLDSGTERFDAVGLSMQQVFALLLRPINMVYTDAACTEAADFVVPMAISEYGNALLIYDHKTYQCAGFEEPASMQGSGLYIVVVFFRSEITTDSAGAAVLKVETAKMDIMSYLAGTNDAPITITAGELPLTAAATT